MNETKPFTAAPAPVPDKTPAVRPAGPESAGRLRVAELLQRQGVLAVLLTVVIAASFVYPTFASLDNARGVTIQASFLAVVALGMTLVIITGGIDLSVGSVFALGGVLAAWASQYGFLAALLLPLVVCGGIGLLNGLLIARGNMAPFIVTLATLLGARGLLLALTDEGATTYLVPKDSAFGELGQGSVWGFGYPIVIALVLFGAGGLVLQRTSFGQTLFAVGGSSDAATLMGLPVARTKILVYTLSGLLAGLAGALNAARLSSGVTIVGVGMELDAISAVVIGGTLLVGGAGSISGTLWGVLLLAVIQNLINQIGSLNSSYQSVVSGGFLIVVVVAQRYLARSRRST
ncbi:ABC transporter permease [Mesorhizobium sp. B2-3-3]|uniref:Inner-membrane translocator n=1 Tax=Streptomyces pratensis (strain ATCC 33331 / IAF-45CD) TaxID=591167 RepID=A0A8D4BJ40_STRFA|nr:MULTISPECIES: ABC transporter permease [Streptomyces]TPN21724.1 ABC transporter permease [Mesorhizobium sp. B2-3-3]MCY1649961.1 ABC transporter permease [Streptomyces sp. SL203]MYT54653.1 ABC transporter permease [Streptomyces sp. SID7815]WSI21202.1 ABC transporter permease [[Kitasatospora] papulosa]WSK32048.1 ABC transporter permease [[Kitasatospora] papulosa]